MTANATSNDPKIESLPEYLTQNEFCDWFRIHPTTLYRWISRGLAPKRVIVGRTIRFMREDVQQWLSQRTRSGA